MICTLNSAGLPNIEKHHRIAGTSDLAARHHMQDRMKSSRKGSRRENGEKARSYNTGKKIRWVCIVDEKAYRWAITGSRPMRGRSSIRETTRNRVSSDNGHEMWRKTPRGEYSY